MVGDFRDLAEVVGDAAHQMPGLDIIKVVKAEFLNMTEKFGPHVEFHSHAEDVSPLDANI